MSSDKTAQHRRPEAPASTARETLVIHEAPAGQSLDGPAYYRIRDVLRITALSRPTLYRRIAARRFPPPVHLGGRACGWRTTALQDWIADPEGYRAPPDAVSTPCRGPGRPRKYLPA